VRSASWQLLHVFLPCVSSIVVWKLSPGLWRYRSSWNGPVAG